MWLLTYDCWQDEQQSVNAGVYLRGCILESYQGPHGCLDVVSGIIRKEKDADCSYVCFKRVEPFSSLQLPWSPGCDHQDALSVFSK